MLLTVHGLTGAALGSLVGDVPGKELIAFTVGWASHYVLDAIPHWERVYRPFQRFNWESTDPLKDWPRHVFYQIGVDILIVLAIFGYLVLLFPNNLAPLFGALGALVPDLLGNVPILRERLRKASLFRIEYNFHTMIHVSKENQARFRSFGLVTQAVVVAAAIWVLS